ncbi:IS3 family transposase [Brevibacillus sp. WF146]|uniref:IS3 family transposase n=1 Tax=Brevibacillus sp. WF146 TaxID=319501 RepID=UPI00222696B5|nr:IS3 family transposase [Brevibacillus sp. WF146]UYZ14564.1 IS3 family transposase [Brevibacillus sp. WF146]
MKKQKEQSKSYSIIHEMMGTYSVSLLCSVSGVSRSGFYKWVKQQQNPSRKMVEDEKLKEMIRECHQEVNGIYGYPRVTVWLTQRYGIHVNRKRVYRLMKEMGIQARIRRKRKFFGRKEQVVISENKLNRDFIASRPNEKWVTDITYLIFNGRRLYLSVIYDLFNNEVVAYRISKRNDIRLVMDTVKAAIKKGDVSGVLLHSDQGFQYTSRQYHNLLKQYNITASMSRKGNCLDNACMESFFSHLKSECMYLHNFQTDEEVHHAVDRYIRFYNHKRFQSRLHNLSPVQYRAQAS